jgi:hypothetical protein
MEGKRRSHLLLGRAAWKGSTMLFGRRVAEKNCAPGDAPEPFAWYCLYGHDAETKERSLEEKTLSLAGGGDDVELYGRRDRSGIGPAPGK